MYSTLSSLYLLHDVHNSSLCLSLYSLLVFFFFVVVECLFSQLVSVELLILLPSVCGGYLSGVIYGEILRQKY